MLKGNFNGKEIDKCDDDSMGVSRSLCDRLNPLFQKLLWSLEIPATFGIVEGVENFMNEKVIECKDNDFSLLKTAQK